MENKNHINKIGNRKNEEIFSGIPENYFENLSSEIKKKITSQNSETDFLYKRKTSLGWALASAFTCILVLVYFNFFYKIKTSDFSENMAYHEFLEEELVSSIDINTDYEILNVSEENEGKTEIISDKIPVQELENFLMEEDEDLILYN